MFITHLMEMWCSSVQKEQLMQVIMIRKKSGKMVKRIKGNEGEIMSRFFEGNPCTYEVYSTVTGKWAVVKHFPMGNAHYYERFKTETEAIEFCKADNGTELVELDIDEIE